MFETERYINYAVTGLRNLAQPHLNLHVCRLNNIRELTERRSLCSESLYVKNFSYLF